MERQPSSVTDARLASIGWPVAGAYDVEDGIDRHDVSGRGWLTLCGQPTVHVRDGQRLVRGAYPLPLATAWVRVIRDPTPALASRRYWWPSDRGGLADELAQLGQGDDEQIVEWVHANGFVGIRANPMEDQESVEEIREACGRLAQARTILEAIRAQTGAELRSVVEHQLGLRSGFFGEMQLDPKQPMGGTNLARAVGLRVPPGASWPGAGSYIQAMYGLLTVLDTPIERYSRVGLDVVSTADGMRLQSQLIGVGPLATAYLRTLDEACWPAIAYEGSVVRLDWRAARHCRRCRTAFRPRRRDQKWCSHRCRWAASKARDGAPA